MSEQQRHLQLPHFSFVRTSVVTGAKEEIAILQHQVHLIQIRGANGTISRSENVMPFGYVMYFPFLFWIHAYVTCFE